MRVLTAISHLAVFASATFAQTGPTVSNVTAAERADGSRLVDIRYNLVNQSACTVWAALSADGGASWSVPAMTFTGDFGSNVAPGANRHIVWDAAADIPGVVGNFRARVYADDGSTMTNMVPVPGGTFPYRNNTVQQVYVGHFYIDKYEVTNQRYAEFLNSADPEGMHWNSSIEITRSGSPPNVFYAPFPGKTNYPVHDVSAEDAEAYAAWLSAREGRTYRLPTEQEWEKAAAWDPTLNKHWTFGFQADSISCAYCNFYVGPPTPCVGSTTEVGHYDGANGTNDAQSYYGCYDMTGNVFELTTCGSKCIQIRGGSYVHAFNGFYGFEWYSTFRYPPGNWGASNRAQYVGFRLILDLN